ncbi:hypothetical protein [Streptomyces sp. NPDC047841]|uniref:hypothetical protein n=1 Tax=Streptomyces sp. NPDC047841 TaxID=3154708 RepID=UPI003454229E
MSPSAAPATPRSAHHPALARRAVTIAQPGTGREPLRTGAPVPATAIAARRPTGGSSAR